MQTRTELILLQRTMVVVEGVARSLDPQINMWEAARPVVQDYVRDNLGPRAALRDGLRIAQTVFRFGPVLPDLIETRLGELARKPEPARGAQARIATGWIVPVAMLAAGLVVGYALG